MNCPHCNLQIDSSKLWKEGGFCPHCKQIILIDEPEKEQDIEFIESKGMVSFNSIKKVFSDSHNHLRLYERIESKLGLEGEKYYTAKKWLSYFYESKLQRAMQIKIGSASYDNRTHALIVATAGKGKGVIKNAVKQSFKVNKEDVMEASGLVHPEQLIGKTKYVGRGKERKAVEAKGYLSAEILLHDETNATINETAPNSDQSMRVKRSAMDCYGYNQISKKLVDDLMKDALEYNPTVRCIDFMHPEQFQNCFFDKGTYRRYVCFELANNKQITLEDSIKSITEETVDYQEERDLLYALSQESRKHFTDFQMNDDCKKIASKWILLWNGFLLNNDHPALRRFGEMTFYSIKDYFFKYIIVLHGANKKEISEPELTHLACMDTIHFLLDTVETYCKYGDLANTSDVWRGAKGMEIRALEYLWRKGAVSEAKSTVRVDAFLEVLSELFGVQERQAKGILSNLKSRQYVNTKQVGQTGSKVWICFEPEISRVVLQEFGLEEFWGEKIEGCNGCNVFSDIGVEESIKLFYTRINPIINKIKYKYKEELNSFCNSKPDLNFFYNKEVSQNDGFGVNKQVVENVCTPCTPEGISGSVVVEKQAPGTSTTRNFMTKSACELPDGEPLIGRCSGCGKSQQEIVAINREFRVGYCESCYERLDN